MSLVGSPLRLSPRSPPVFNRYASTRWNNSEPQFHCYADSTQLYLPIQPSDQAGPTIFAKYLEGIRGWIANNFTLNCQFLKQLSNHIGNIKKKQLRIVWYYDRWKYNKECYTRLLASLHWCPIQYRIHCKILQFVLNAPHGLSPSYITEFLFQDSTAWPFRSSEKRLFDRKLDFPECCCNEFWKLEVFFTSGQVMWTQCCLFRAQR